MITADFERSLTDLGLSPQARAPLTEPSGAWSIDLGHGLAAEVALMRTSYDDHLLVLSLALEAATRPEHWLDLDTYAHVFNELAAPCRLVRLESELGLTVQGRARGLAALELLATELVFLMRQATALFLEPWLQLAKGRRTPGEAGIEVGSRVAARSAPAKEITA